MFYKQKVQIVLQYLRLEMHLFYLQICLQEYDVQKYRFAGHLRYDIQIKYEC